MVTNFSEKEREFFRLLLEAEVVSPTTLAQAFASAATFYDVLSGLEHLIDRDELISFGLRMNPEFIYVPSEEPNGHFLNLFGRDKAKKLYEEHGVVPLEETLGTLWIGVARTYPNDCEQITSLCGSCTLGWRVLPFDEFIRIVKKIKKNT